MRSAKVWAEEEFGAAALGDRRRTVRLVELATEVAQAPAGTVTGACRSSASREGAFRWLENQAVQPGRVAASVKEATLRRCQAEKRVHVAVDATTLTLTDTACSKGFGAVGSWKMGGRGIQVMTALAVHSDGTAAGVVAQEFWVRERRSKRPEKATSTHAPDRETHHWIDVLHEADDAFRQTAPNTQAFYQLDRGADCWPVLATAIERGLLLTVRAAHDRNVDTSAQKLWDEMARAPVRDAFKIAVPKRTKVRKRKRVRGKRVEWTINRDARLAEVTVRATAVPLLLSNGQRIMINAVLVRERHRRDDDRIEWLLLSTHPIRTRVDVRQVIHGYALRWKIEEFHRTWKRGLCRVEDTQLRSRQAVFKWATILASVATRAMRLTYQARETPDVAATDELTRFEIDAVIALRRPKDAKLGDTPTLGQAVRWIADLGGYVGPWNGPPGPKVIGRGLDDVLAAAKALEAVQKMR